MLTHTITEYRPDYPPAYLANGVIGLRVGSIPQMNGTAVVNGYVGVNDEERTEGYEPAIYPLNGDFMLGGLWVSQRPDLVTFREQSYDFASGELITRYDFTVNGATAHVTVVTFCCRSMPTIAAQEVRVQVDRPTKVGFIARLNPTELPGEVLHREIVNPGWLVADGCILMRSRGGLSTLGVAQITGCSEKVENRRNTWGYNSHAIDSNYAMDAQPGRDHVFWQFGCLVPSVMHPEPDREAIRLIGIAKYRGFEQLRSENKAAWTELWKGRVKLLGADAKWQHILDAAFFYLHTSAHQSSPCSVAPYGQGQWRHYLGHIFWDTETMMFPSVLLTAPHAARAMLDYRIRLLPAARNNAALQGYRGLQFPWESANSGAEVMSARYIGIFREHHISADVAFAFAQYAHATGDEQFLRQHAWPVLKGVAEWLVSRVATTERGYEIRSVTGIDEGVDNANNNSYTNLSAIVVLREAISAARRLGMCATGSNIAASGTLAIWEDIASRMVVPVDSKTQVILNYDGYEYKGGACCPEALVAMYPLTYRASEEIERATYDFFIKLAHTFLALPHVPPSLAVHAARRGDRKLAAELFEGCVGNWIAEPFLQFREFGGKLGRDHTPVTLPFVTNAGSTLMACLYGFTGLQLAPEEPQSWCKFPITMPEGWEGIEVERIWARGKPARLIAKQGDARARIEM